jgi:PAS domain S-box-containing protein
MAEAVFELDTCGIITYVNESARLLLGRQEWELIGRDFSGEFSADHAAGIQEALGRIMHTAHSRTADLSVRMRERELFLSFRNVIRDDEIIGATVVVNDVTEKKLLDQERCLRERLTGVIEMASAAAHELNQPLTVISGHAQLLLRHCAGSEELERRARIIYAQIEGLGRLTRKFSDIATYKTKDFGDNLTIIDIEGSSRPDGG